MIDYKENWKKRLVYVLLGVVISYFGVIPIHVIIQIIFPVYFTTIWTIFGSSFLRFVILAIFLYMAFVRVKPSFIPKQRNYRRLVILIILLIPTFSILLTSGYVVPQWESGYCTMTSVILIKGDTDHESSTTTSFGTSSESECRENCKNISNASSDRGNSCEFTGIYGKTHWQKTSTDFADVDEKIRFEGTK